MREKQGYSINPRDYINIAVGNCKKCGIDIDLDNPRTIQSKLMWLNLYDDDIRKSDCADKVKLRDYCKEVLGKDICIPILKVWSSPNGIDFDELPTSFVLKCNHGSGMNIVVKDKDSLNKEEAISKLNCWMKKDYAFTNGFEAHYHDIERKVFAEKFVSDGHKTLCNYKVWCFNGEPRFYTIVDGEGYGTFMLFYDMENNPLPYKRKEFLNIPIYDIRMPSDIHLMGEYARKLSNPFKFTRVDFYEIDGEIRLGELTFTPWSSIIRYEDQKHDIEIGDMLDLGKN